MVLDLEDGVERDKESHEIGVVDGSKVIFVAEYCLLER